MTFGEKVRIERTRLKISQTELANRLGVTQRVIYTYEKDLSRPRGVEKYKKLAETLGVNLNYLLTEDEIFVENVENEFGYRGKVSAKKLVSEIKGLFAGGDMEEEDKDELMFAIQEAYVMAKKKNKKYTPKKYLKNEDNKE